MSNTMLRGLILGVFLAMCLGACGAETSDEDSVGNDNIELHSFTGDVRSCTPYLGSSSLDQWSDWDPDSAGSVLGKLFNPSDGKDECLYTHFVTLDDHIEMVNRFRGHWMRTGCIPWTA